MPIDKGGRHMLRSIPYSTPQASITPQPVLPLSSSLPFYICQPATYHSRCMLYVQIPQSFSNKPTEYDIPISGKIESVKVNPSDILFVFSNEKLKSTEIVGRDVVKDEKLSFIDDKGQQPLAVWAEIVLQVPVDKNTP